MDIIGDIVKLHNEAASLLARINGADEPLPNNVTMEQHIENTLKPAFAEAMKLYNMARAELGLLPYGHDIIGAVQQAAQQAAIANTPPPAPVTTPASGFTPSSIPEPIIGGNQ